MKNAIVPVFLLLLVSGTALAETRYVSDNLEITMRSGTGTSYGITRMLRSGTPLDVILERIPFTQTHRYVRKVLVHYQAYRSQHQLGMPQLSVVLPEPRIDPLAF